MSELIICGRGGQGVVFLTRQIGQIISDQGINVISSETHGMAVRGGSINSHLRIGDFHSPLIRNNHADYILSLDESETANNIHFLRPDGLVIENSTKSDEAGTRRIDATSLAAELGRIQLENIVLLGFASALKDFPINSLDIRLQLEKEKRDVIREMNLKALALGIAAAENRN